MSAKNQKIAENFNKHDLERGLHVLIRSSRKYECPKLDRALKKLERIIVKDVVINDLSWRKVDEFAVTWDTPINLFIRGNLWGRFLKRLQSWGARPYKNRESFIGHKKIASEKTNAENWHMYRFKAYYTIRQFSFTHQRYREYSGYKYEPVSLTRERPSVENYVEKNELTGLYKPEREWLTVEELLLIRRAAKKYDEEKCPNYNRNEVESFWSKNNKRIVDEVDSFLEWVLPQVTDSKK